MPTPEAFRRNIVDKHRLLIAAIDGFKGHVRAHFNPKEVQFDKKVNWQESKQAGQNEPTYEYTAGTPRTMSMELLFDRFEIAGQTVEPELEALHRMCIGMDPQSKNKLDRRPPQLVIHNGPIPFFECVLESLVVKVIMFNREGRPVRATANVTFKETRLKGVKIERPNSAPSQRGDRDGHNWQKPSNEEQAKTASKDQQDRDRRDASRNGNQDRR